MAVALALASGRAVGGTVAAGMAVFCGQLTVGWHNDWLDVERDARAGRADKPLAQGLVGRRTVGTAALVSGLATVPLSFLSGVQAAVAHIVAVGLALAYNARLKATLVSFVPYALAFPLLVAFISLGRHSSAWPPWWALAGASLLGTGAHLANASPDVVEDRSAGVLGLPQRLGPRLSIAGALVLMVASTLVIGVGPGGRWSGPVTVLAVLAVLVGVAMGFGLTLAMRRSRPTQPAPLQTTGGTGSRAWFQVTLVVAMANVALLVSRGSRF